MSRAGFWTVSATDAIFFCFLVLIPRISEFAFSQDSVSPSFKSLVAICLLSDPAHSFLLFLSTSVSVSLSLCLLPLSPGLPPVPLMDGSSAWSVGHLSAWPERASNPGAKLYSLPTARLILMADLFRKEPKPSRKTPFHFPGHKAILHTLWWVGCTQHWDFSPKSKLRTQALTISPSFLALVLPLPPSPPSTHKVVNTSPFNCFELYLQKDKAPQTCHPSPPSWRCHCPSSEMGTEIRGGSFDPWTASPLRPLLKTTSHSLSHSCLSFKSLTETWRRHWESPLTLHGKHPPIKYSFWWVFQCSSVFFGSGFD